METKSHVEPCRWTSTAARQNGVYWPWTVDFLTCSANKKLKLVVSVSQSPTDQDIFFPFLLGNMTQVIKSRCATNSPTFMTQFSFAFLFLMDTFGHPKSWCTFDILDFKPSITQTNLLYNKRIKLLDYFSTLNYMLGNIGKMYYACKIQLFCMDYFPSNASLMSTSST